MMCAIEEPQVRFFFGSEREETIVFILAFSTLSCTLYALPYKVSTSRFLISGIQRDLNRHKSDKLIEGNLVNCFERFARSETFRIPFSSVFNSSRLRRQS